MNYKISQYNIIISKTKEKVYIYNSYSGGVCSLDTNIYQEMYNGYTKEKPYFEQLLSEGFIVPEELNEYGRLLSQQNEYLLKDNKHITIVIAPTIACNLNCLYCFEHEKNSNILNNKVLTMSKETADKTVEFIETQLEKSKNTSEITIYWFGGEPLLKLDIIEYISEKLISFCSNNNISYNSFMITNGLLLNEKKSLTLQEKCKVKKIQLTIDGNNYYYGLYKNTSLDSLERLINNIKFSSKLFNISVRMNTSVENQDEIIQQAKDIMTNKEISETVTVYPAQITDCEKPLCHSMSDSEFELFRRKFEFELKPLRAENGSKPIKIARRLSYCNSMKKNHFVVGPNGAIYKCEHELGKREQVIGDVHNGFYYNNAYSQFYDCPLDEKCSKCNFLPFCWGGCPSSRIIYKKTVDCDSLKQRILNKLEQEFLLS